jgi:BMFP domain-containing protein YqiC
VNVDGILHLHNLAGVALATAQQEVEALRARVAELEQQVAALTPPPDGLLPNTVT